MTARHSPSASEPLGLPTNFADPVRNQEIEYQHRQALLRWMHWPNTAAVPITLTFKARLQSGNLILRFSDQEGVNCLRHLMNVLNERTFGRQFRKGNKRLKEVFFKEFGSDRGFHLHGKIEIPQHCDREAFEALIADTWNSIDWAEGVHFGEHAGQAWDLYITKRKSTGQISDHIVLV